MRSSAGPNWNRSWPGATPPDASAECPTPRRWPSSCAATPPSGSPARCTRSTAATSPRCKRFGPLSGLGIQLSLVRPVLLSGLYGCACTDAPAEAPRQTQPALGGKRRGRSPRRAPARPTVWERTREAAGLQLQGHGADTIAVGLVILGVL